MSGYMYNVNAIKKLSDQELSSGSGKSWHDQYSDSAWVFVGGLPYELTEGDVLCVFSQYGEIVNINMVRDKKTGKPKGFAFICYENQKSTVLAVDNFNGVKIKGRTIRVDHVASYRVPKEHEDEDEITKKIRQEGVKKEKDDPGYRAAELGRSAARPADIRGNRGDRSDKKQEGDLNYKELDLRRNRSPGYREERRESERGSRDARDTRDEEGRDTRNAAPSRRDGGRDVREAQDRQDYKAGKIGTEETYRALGTKEMTVTEKGMTGTRGVAVTAGRDKLESKEGEKEMIEKATVAGVVLTGTVKPQLTVTLGTEGNVTRREGGKEIERTEWDMEKERKARIESIETGDDGYMCYSHLPNKHTVQPGETYVGETERSLGERSGEHQKSIDRKDYKSALSQHQLQTGHRVTTQPILDTIEIIDQEARNAHRKIKEAIHIQLVGAKLNRNEGWELPKPYLPLLRKEAEGGRRSTQVSS
ncbi:RNA-binding motif protein, X-linked 2 [Branchiostoma belcheri]|nr:RNA-binding motif protein, X-linked 2 [Branchiostoma belcheri]